ncbi:MAG: Leucyl-tRNA synthetase (EC [uncultured Aureispira sp.]|uniref:Leucine--tRNA ligase n=1 Tax=uncultured Aureispira sp. TaxID=1331704 RepID=A0A6S6UGH6_9BACT|nr:MAG: Leucyl-tRNA synthetase (EC [uncultured Aureispira sp.]
MDYESGEIEAKWKQYWVENEVYKTSNDTSKPKYYVLDMFPYPSGAGLHVGHPLGYIASDIFARYKRLQGYNVLHPMGYDAFGLPAEQYAIQTGVHPAVSTSENIRFYRKQLDNLGFSFDWSRSVNTSDPSYYKWTQHIFLKIFGHYYNNETNKATPIETLVATFEQEGNANVQATSSQETTFSAEEWSGYSPKEQDDILMNYRLAYRKVGFVNWCEELGTVLANDEVKDGVSERGGYPVVKKPMRQWALRITAYAERLLDGLEQVDFSEALKTQQRNWIGRSEGAQLFFDVPNSTHKIEVFTTRPDTIFGATFMVLAPEHDLVAEITTEAQKEAITAYQAYANSRSERDRMADVKTITGAFTGAYAVNPFTGKEVPVWIADYVLISYGTGAIMAVPSGDERDARFAEHFDLDIVQVVDQSAHEGAAIGDKVGVMVNSGFLDGLPVVEAITKAIEEINTKKIGEGKINYRLRDANFSRQRYWGEPFPIKYDADGVSHAETNLPLELPTLDNFKPTKEGKAPLARAEDWVKEGGMTREIDTMPGFAGSSWYFLRYMDPTNDAEPFSAEAVNYWQEVDLYVGGAEHAVGHLMYSRFWHKFMFDLGMVPTREPYKKLVNQGMLQGVIEFLYMLKEKQDGKSVFVSADKLSEYEGQEFAQIPVHIDFMTDYGKPESYLNEDGRAQFKAWRPDYNNAVFVTNAAGQVITKSEVGKISKRYFNVVNPDDVVSQYGTDCFRMYEMFLGPLEDSKPWDTKGITGVSKFLRKFWNLFHNEGEWIVTDEKATPEELKTLHTAIKKVNQDVANFSFNTCIAHFMVATNELKKANCSKREILEVLIVLMAPFAPFITEELWSKLGNEGSVHVNGTYPAHEEAYLVQSTITYPVCIKGKKRATITVGADATKETIEKEALAVEEVQKWIDGKPIRKVIVVPKRMVNIVI